MIVKYKEYKFWTNVDESIHEGKSIKNYVTDELKIRFPNMRILGQYFEFNNIDLYIVEERLPVEIQSIRTRTGARCPNLNDFERLCRDQIEENIKNLGKCWFFFNEDLLSYMQKEKCSHTSIQLDWFYKLMKEDKLKVFTVDCNGNIKERALEDFNFISKISVTCEIGKDNDKRILQKNKYDILKKIFDFYNITQKEMDDLGKEYINADNQLTFIPYACRHYDDRKSKIGNIFHSLNGLNDINEFFGGIYKKVTLAICLGMFESEGSGKINNRIKFHNNSEVAEYFPMYLRNKEKWDNIKGKWLTARQLQGIIEGKVDYDWYKKL